MKDQENHLCAAWEAAEGEDDRGSQSSRGLKEVSRWEGELSVRPECPNWVRRGKCRKTGDITLDQMGVSWLYMCSQTCQFAQPRSRWSSIVPTAKNNDRSQNLASRYCLAFHWVRAISKAGVEGNFIYLAREDYVLCMIRDKGKKSTQRVHAVLHWGFQPMPQEKENHLALLSLWPSTYQEELNMAGGSGLLLLSDVSVYHGWGDLTGAAQTMTAAERGQEQDVLKGPSLVACCLLLGLTSWGFYHVARQQHQLETGFNTRKPVLYS